MNNRENCAHSSQHGNLRYKKVAKKAVCDLKTKFTEWQQWLVGDDRNSIRNQIYDMIWDSAVFQSINECRRYAPTNAKGEIELNGVVHRFIDKCFFETQALAIRRILDEETSRGKRSVISLYRLIDDIENHSDLLTRGNILAVHGYPYEYEQERNRLTEEAFRNVPSGQVVVMGQDYHKCCTSETTHRFIDSLAGVDPSKRSPDDRIRPQIFGWLKQHLRRCKSKSIGEFVNKFIAHPATPESRGNHNPSELDITLGQILEAQEIICQTAMFISGRMGILSEGHSIGDVLAVPQFDQFVHFDKAWASEKTVEKLYDFWRKYDMQTINWHNWDWQVDLKNFLHEGKN